MVIIFVKLCFLHNIYVCFISWQKCFNFINLFSCILWDLIIMGLVLSSKDLLKTLEFTTNSSYNTREGHMRSTCRKLKSQCISWVAHDLAKSWSELQNAQTTGICVWLFLSFTHTIYTLTTHKIVNEPSYRKP